MKRMPFLLIAVLLAPSTAVQAATLTSLSALLSGGESQTCTFERSDPAGSEKGTVYVTHGRMRGDFELSEGGTMHMIRDGITSYSWGGSTGDKQGIVVDVSANPAVHGLEEGPDLEEDIEMECSPWQEDESFFEPPQDVAFQRINMATDPVSSEAAMPTVDPKALKCSDCDQAPEGVRTNCRRALGCA